jgi:lipoate---protein ligase
MTWFDVTQPTLAENLAFDDVLLAEVDRDPTRGLLRFWELDHYAVVLGRSNRADVEANLGACRLDHTPVVRRSSGGGAVVIGPGCLAYSLVLPLTDEQRALGVASLTKRLMGRIALGLQPVQPRATACGTSDLAADNRKFSGNAQRWLSRAFLHHGTILYDFDLDRIGRYLRTPSRQPNYRDLRGHSDFVRNIAVPREKLIEFMATTWKAFPGEAPHSAAADAARLEREKYTAIDWTILPTPFPDSN